VPRWLRGGHERRPEKPEGEGEHNPHSATLHGGVPQPTRVRSPWVGQRYTSHVASEYSSADLRAIGMQTPPAPPRAGSHHLIIVLRLHKRQRFVCLKNRRDTVGELKNAEICVSRMPSWKAKKLGKLTQEKVLLEL
jgi:hypothetical protein